MHRIDGPGHVLNHFSSGNPAIGQQATMVTAEWSDDVQENLCRLIEEAGIALVKGDGMQLYAAVLAIAAGAAGAGGGAVPTTRQVNTAGLATGGGDLAADRTITVPKASAADVATGTDDTKAVTALALQGGIGGALLAGTGYKTILGLVFVWGTYTVSANSSVNITFPTTFPTMCTHCDVTGGRLDYGAQDNNPFVSGKSASGATVFNAGDTGTSGTYFAIGF
ncbi:hypothetical protein [Sphingopyxis sp. GW247-27LB]|uniref:gp53-like domain-containing protein n=1 Tax=Sphingopyxis sp. GW247-27LB TaxID=2012632 RepID=UPI000BA656A9|nr:hypothetical protein [Sphingopyxis sp. GW247-27LB]PAL25465.1 hypothetical protein CD928_03050 [Sphingopyxis sp. GW247-27LB]